MQKNPRSIGYYIKRTNDCPYSSGNLFPGHEASSSDVQTDRLPKSARDVATHDRGELRAARRRRRHRRETTQTNAARSPATPTIRSRRREKTSRASDFRRSVNSGDVESSVDVVRNSNLISRESMQELIHS